MQQCALRVDCHGDNYVGRVPFICAALESNTTLHSLNVCSNNIPDHQMERLIDAVEKQGTITTLCYITLQLTSASCSITELDVSHNYMRAKQEARHLGTEGATVLSRSQGKHLPDQDYVWRFHSGCHA